MSVGNTRERQRRESPPGPSALDLSVIIVNWNTRDLLADCLGSLNALPGLSSEVIVVDNGSGDGSQAMVAETFPDVELIANARNRGFAAANNQGIARATGHYILLLNSDTLVRPGALEAMVRYMDTHPEIGALGPRLLNADGSLQSSARDFPSLTHDALAVLEVSRWPLVGAWAERYMRRACYYSDHRSTQRVDWLMGACLLLRRAALDQIGTLDEGYFFFAEEMDLCYRLARAGWQTVFLAEAEIVHLGGMSAARIPVARLVWHYRGMLRFYRLHRTTAQTAALRAAIALSAAIHLASLLVRHRHPDETLSMRAGYARVLTEALTW